MKARLLVAFGLFALSAAVPGSATPVSKVEMPATAADVGAALEKLSAEDHSVKDHLTALAEENAGLEAMLAAKGRAYIKLTRAGLLPIGGGLPALVDHASKIERLRRALSRALDRQSAIARERLDLSQKQGALGDHRATLEIEEAALSRSRTAILAAEERETAFRRAFISGRGPHTTVYGSGFGPLDPEEARGGFAGMKGRLQIPIEGRVEVRPGRLPGGEGPGLDLLSPAGAPVRAVYAGRVTFADSHGEYGKTVILDHGGGYFSVCAHFQAIDVHVGDEVRAGSQLGTVGTGPGGALLHLELRRGAETLDPAPWFGL